MRYTRRLFVVVSNADTVNNFFRSSFLLISILDLSSGYLCVCKHFVVVSILLPFFCEIHSKYQISLCLQSKQTKIQLSPLFFSLFQKNSIRKRSPPFDPLKNLSVEKSFCFNYSLASIVTAKHTHIKPAYSEGSMVFAFLFSWVQCWNLWKRFFYARSIRGDSCLLCSSKSF